MFVKMYFVLLVGLLVCVQGQPHTITTTYMPTDLYIEVCLNDSGAIPSDVLDFKKGYYDIPDQSNLVRWGKATKKSCNICGEAAGTAKHLLVGCRVLLDKGQYSRCHDKNLSEELKKFVFCYLKKTGIMSSTGVLRQDVVLKNIHEEDHEAVEDTINKCLYDKAHDPVDTAWHYLTCFRSENPKLSKDANRI